MDSGFDHDPGKFRTSSMSSSSSPPGAGMDYDDILREISANGPLPEAALVDDPYQPWSTVTDDSPRLLGQYSYLPNMTQDAGGGWEGIGASPPFGLSDFGPSQNLGSYDDYFASLSQADSVGNSSNHSDSYFNFLGTLNGLGGPAVSTNADFYGAVHEGQSLYSDALNQWNSDAGAYNPFKTSHVLRNESTSPVGSGSSKPSYSDVAKHKGSSKKKVIGERKAKESGQPKQEPFSPINAFPRQQKRVKSRTPYQPRFKPGDTTNAGQEREMSTVKPDSKYGLDDFEVPTTSGKFTKNTPVDSLPNVSRKGSNSSQASSASGLDEISLTKPLGVFSTSARNGNDTALQNGYGAASQTAEGSADSSLFFDPRRIFQRDRKSSKTRQSAPTHSAKSEDTVLNNQSTSANASSSSHKTSSTYINNDLRDHFDPKKQKNATQNCGSGSDDGQSKGGSGKGSGCSNPRKNGPQVNTKGTEAGSGSKRGRKTKQQPNLLDAVGDWLTKAYGVMKWLMTEFLLWVLLALVVLSKLLWLSVSSVFNYTSSLCINIWNFFKNKVRSRWKGKDGDDFYDWSNASSTSKYRSLGLEENIQLPTTGEDAMKRLHACKGKDPYSILGLRCDASDEDIKKYYKRQAILVHPDKNQQPGAEEAFKILGHAFELIGEPDKRQQFNAQAFQANTAETAWKEFADLLTKLHEKMEEAANMMRCDYCGGKHKRIKVDRPWYSARYCDRCQARHSVKEGDVWAETSWFGFLWHYYACMDGNIYDITEWAGHQTDYFKHIQANAHHVFYRLQTSTTRQHQSSNNAERTGEAELEDFLNTLFHQGMRKDKTSATGGPPGTSRGADATTTAANKRRRKKKRH